MVNRSIDIVISAYGTPLAGQQNASLNQTAEVINITNKINGDWRENLTGARSWRVVCSGLYVVTEGKLNVLQDAFMNNTPLDIEISLDDAHYTGSALLVNFPINTDFNRGATYRAEFLGTGPLVRSDPRV